jgi:release factor glutamine methyltransferase
VIEILSLQARRFREAARFLGAAGIEHPDRECRWIWENVTGRQWAIDVDQPEDDLPTPVAARFSAVVDRRGRGEPLAHVLEEAEFRHLRLHSDRRALIPRPETEGLVDLVLDIQRSGRIVDIGTGTGCIALSLATEGDYELVVGVEKSLSTLALARQNFEAVPSGARLISGDLCQALPDNSFDVLVSNPPYLNDREYASLDASVKHWEPEAALRSGPDGLEMTRELLAQGWRVVKREGWIVLEVDCTRATATALEAVRTGWSDVLVKDDLFGRARYLVARRSE